MKNTVERKQIHSNPEELVHQLEWKDIIHEQEFSKKLKKINWICEETKQQEIRMAFKFTLSWSPFIEMFCRPLRQPALWRYLENFTSYERFTNLIESVQFWFEPKPVISLCYLYRPQITDETLVIKQVLSKNKFARYSKSWKLQRIGGGRGIMWCWLFHYSDSKISVIPLFQARKDHYSVRQSLFIPQK